MSDRRWFGKPGTRYIRCGPTGKRLYKSEAAAMMAHPEMPRAYRCEYCGGWHLTSKPARHKDGK